MRVVALLLLVGVVIFVGVGSALGDTIVGGDIKFFLYDKSSGDVDVVAPPDRSVDYESENNSSAGVSSAIIYISSDLSDDVSVELQPEILVEAGATPRLGDASFYRNEVTGTEIEFLRANITWRLPSGFELKGGYLKPLFTWDYGYELFWHEEYNGSYVAANPWLGAWHDSGIEIYKNFETDEFSVPAYLYLLNGPDGSESDNNENKSVMLHVAPEFMSGRLKLLGSFGMGKWDSEDKNSFTRYAAGASFAYSGFMVRGEYMGGKWEDKTFGFGPDATVGDINPFGYYVKAFYQFMPKARVFGAYSHLDHDFSGFFYTASSLSETYDTYEGGVDYELADGATAMLTYSKVDAEREAEEGARSDYSAKLDYSRITLGFRVTF
jgi:hypothetical protein